MEPIEIKIALMRRGITQTEIARRRGVTPTHVYRVIHGGVSNPVRREIAAAINKDVTELWPEAHPRKEDQCASQGNL